MNKQIHLNKHYGKSEKILVAARLLASRGQVFYIGCNHPKEAVGYYKELLPELDVSIYDDYRLKVERKK